MKSTSVRKPVRASEASWKTKKFLHNLKGTGILCARLRAIACIALGKKVFSDDKVIRRECMYIRTKSGK
jgi:hypothetical protein